MKNRNLGESVKNAAHGIVYCIDGERNMKIHTLAASIAILMSVLLKITILELLLIILAIALVFITEMLNTSLEYLIDASNDDNYNVNIKKTKDISAAAVLIASLFSLAAGYTVFVPRILDLIGIPAASDLYFTIMVSTAAVIVLVLLLISATKGRRT